MHGELLGPHTFELFAGKVSKTAETFSALSTGEEGFHLVHGKSGPNTNDSQFIIRTTKMEWLDGKHQSLASNKCKQHKIMATNYSANQYEKAFSSKYLQNWSPAKPTKECISSHEGYTQIIANDRGHLLPSVPRSKANPWGSFMGTWQMPLKIPPARVTLTSRTTAGAASLTKWIQKNPDLLKASNGLHPEILGKSHDPDSQKTFRKKSITKTVQ
ncbi:hypothetical protein P7K49_006810 [Saguinus oedipus]|uniref:Protein Flattop n=1 Tax=Saguinus oedipus TaxID=9490 RepID=A0ABQ9W543_SAGOE|nr:hypothetical protein P7K49_006810 [Saguinus oedipus]